MHSNGKGLNKRLDIEVKMTCEKTIRALHNYYGGQFRSHKMPDGYKPQWIWRCVGKEAREVLKKIEPFSITKRETIQNLLK